MVLGAGQSGFTYSTDGEIWAPVYANTPKPRDEGPLLPIDLWVRLATPDMNVVELASTGQPETWARIGADGIL